MSMRSHHAGTPHAHTGTNGVEFGVVRKHRHFGAEAGVAGSALDFDQALTDFRHFYLEELNQKLRADARRDHRAGRFPAEWPVRAE